MTAYHTIRVLTAPIANPKPDRRKNGLAGAKEIPAGRYIVTPSSIYAADRRYNGINRYDSKPAFDAFIAASTEVAPHGIRELLASLDAEDSGRAILGVLLFNGVITEDHIKVASSQLDADEKLYEQI